MIQPKTTTAANTAITSKTITANTLNSVTPSVQAQVKSSITENLSSIREAATVLSATKIKPTLGSSLPSQDPGKGGSTGGVLESIKSPGLDKSRIGGGNVSADPKDEPGSGWLNMSQNDKDTAGAISVVAGATAGIIGILAAGTTAPVWVPALAVGLTASAATAAVLEKKGTPVPDAIIGTFSGITVSRNGVSFDPLTGMGPSKLQTLGQFTGDQTKGSGVFLTWQEVRNLSEALSKANGNHEKTPNPITDSDKSGVIDNRNMQAIQLMLAGGGAAGPIMQGNEWLTGAISASQFHLAVNNALLA